MYIYDFDAVICEYLPDGMTHAQPRESKKEKRRIRKIEQKILKSVNLSHELIEFKRAKSHYFKAMDDKSIILILKSLKNILRWRIRLLLNK